MADRKRFVVIGAGNMGGTHAKALRELEQEVVALVSRGDSKDKLNVELGGNIPTFTDWQAAIDESKPDAVVIASPTATHFPITQYALQTGMHVFCEKPIAQSGREGRQLQALAKQQGKILNIGYILEYSEGYGAFVKHARSLHGPYDIFMALNQQSSGKNWETHKTLISEAGSPVVDCAPHYLSIAQQIIDAPPVRVYGSGIKLHPDLPQGTFDSAMIEVNYGDGSRFQYQAAWGPFVAPEGFSTKKVNTPRGFVQLERKNPAIIPASDYVPAHVNVEIVRKGYSALDADGRFARQDELYDYKNASEHDNLGRKQMQYFLDCIHGKEDSTAHLERAVSVTELALIGHQSALERRVITILEKHISSFVL